jgi:L-aminopeptidase/D-esterase-like protein
MSDGDTIFAVATGKMHADLNVIGLLGARAVERAVIAAVKNTTSLCGFRCYADLEG